MKRLANYVEGSWKSGAGERPVTLVNPSTEEVIAETDTSGIDFGRALAFAREEGGAHLRSLTFAERGALLTSMSRAIHAHRDELLDLGIENGGNTRSDAKFDVDGATGTLAYYGNLGKELAERRHLVDGETVQLARSPRFVGTHLLLPRQGVAVHVNAFNFPAWGLGEKCATAILAGMPVVVKPATSTAIVAHRIAEILVEEVALPRGVFSVVAGPPGDLLKHLTGEDVLAFTGGSATAHMLRGLDAIVKDSVRINIEADSLNAAVLGPDAAPGSDVYLAFLRDVVRDMTQKTGQKCTAIRRVIVPKSLVDEVARDLSDRLRDVVVGNPAHDKVTMGPLSTKSQLVDIQKGIARLKEGCERVFGGDAPSPIGAPEGKGFFVPPTLFIERDAHGTSVVHDHEVFGPVQTILPYEGVVDATRIIRRGKGGLVASLYTDDRAFATAFVVGTGSSLGRIFIVNGKISEHTPGPGTVLPQSIHGGPGRAGGGEELGGLRGLGFYSQRVAVQGDKPLIDTL